MTKQDEVKIARAIVDTAIGVSRVDGQIHCRHCSTVNEHAPGCPFIIAQAILAEADREARDSKIRLMAQAEAAHAGSCEIDDDAKVSEGEDNGAYVQAWVWLDFSGTDLDKEK